MPYNESKQKIHIMSSEAGIQAAFSAGIGVICIPAIKAPDEEFYKITDAVLSSLEDVILWLENDGKNNNNL